MSDPVDVMSQRMRSIGAQFVAAGLAAGAAGNMSGRLGDDILVTASGASLAELGEPVRLTLDGEVMGHDAGSRPTKELPMHLEVYRNAPDVGAAVHLHSPYATLLSTLADLDPKDAIPALTPYLTMRAGNVVALPYCRPGSAELGVQVGAAMREGARAILLRNHGSLAVGRDMDDAAVIAFELESSARLAILSRGLPVVRLSASQRAELR